MFLDEIGEMEIGVQPKLLRFLETRKARRVGGESEYKVNVRVVSATNRNLDTEIAENRFRADLYYRLAEISLYVPPLRTRPEDIAELALLFLNKANERFGKNIESLEPGLIARFQQYHWPGNVRELKSTIDRMVLLFDGPFLRAPWWDMPENRATRSAVPVAGGAGTPASVVAPVQSPLPGPSPMVSSSPAPAVSFGTPPAAAPAWATTPAGDAGFAIPPAPAPGPIVPMAPTSLPNGRQKLALARKLLAESNDNFTWVAAQLGVNSSTLWRWRKAGKLD